VRDYLEESSKEVNDNTNSNHSTIQAKCVRGVIFENGRDITAGSTEDNLDLSQSIDTMRKNNVGLNTSIDLSSYSK